MMKKFLRWNALLLALCCCLTAFALAEDEPVVITTSVDTLTVAVGRIVDYELSISPRSAKKGYTFTISDETVAEVLRDGRVKGRKQGTCTLTIGSKVDPTATKVLDVIVVQPAKSVKAQLDQETLSVGQTAQITASLSPEDATLQGVTYESRKPEVATVDENGVVTGVSRGSATIRVKSEDGYAQTSVTVQVRQPAEEIQLELAKATLPEGKTATVKATVLPKAVHPPGRWFQGHQQQETDVEFFGREHRHGEPGGPREGHSARNGHHHRRQRRGAGGNGLHRCAGGSAGQVRGL